MIERMQGYGGFLASMVVPISAWFPASRGTRNFMRWGEASPSRPQVRSGSGPEMAVAEAR